MLTITHTHEAGTMIDGTSRGDGTAEVLKSTGWRWGRSISAWFVPQSRDRLPKLHTITRTKSALEAAGFEVETEIDNSHRTTADVEAGKIERQADRVEALAAKAERKTGAEDAAYDKARAALDRLPEGGEPIKVGHHSEGRHRNAITKADTAMRRSVEASAEATTAQARADAATHTTDARYNPVTVANRIETLGAELRKLERRITAQCYDDTRGYIDATAEQIQARATRLAPHIDEKRDQIAYWEAVRAAQVDSGKATGYDRSTVKKGDRVKIRGQWRIVVRANRKTVSVATDYTWIPALTVETAARLLGVSTRHTATILSRPRRHKLIVKHPEGWARSKRDLRDHAAVTEGVAGALADRADRYRAEREVWAW